MHIIFPERKLCRYEKHEVCICEDFPSPSLIEELWNYDNMDRSVAFVPSLPNNFNVYIVHSGWWCPNTNYPFLVHLSRRGSRVEPDFLSRNMALLCTEVD